MTTLCKSPRIIPSNPLAMGSGEMGIAMRQRAEILKAKLPFDLAQTIDIFLDMAAQVNAMDDGFITDYGRTELIADLYRLDELLPD